MSKDPAQRIIQDGTGLTTMSRREAREISRIAKNYKLRDWKPSFNRYVPKARTTDT